MKVLLIAIVLGVAALAASNIVVISIGSRLMVPQAEAKTADCIIVPGALVWSNGEPSEMLQDRLNTALELYNAGVSKKIIVSGDHGQKDYDEVNAMRRFLEEKGVPTESIFMDHAGFDTYSTMYRARDVFMVRNAVIVTQKYHLYRALYLADSMGIQAQGVACDRYKSPKQLYYDVRELAARSKDFLMAGIFKPKPKYLGDEIPISGTGVVTHDH